MAAAVINPAYLSAYSSIPESTIDTLIGSPTVELVSLFLEAITVKAQDHDRLKSEQLRRDVELENAIRGGESRARALRANADKALEEVETLRKKLNEEENARSSLEAEVRNLRSSTSTTTTEVQTLHSRITKLESSNRDTLSLLDAKSTAHDKLAEDLSAQHQKILALRREISNLQERNQAADNNESNAKFREQALQQEVELLKRNNEWFDSELKTKSAEHGRYRKEKSARIAELQRVNDDSASNIESLKRTENTLRKRVEELGQKADEVLSRIQQLQEDAARNEESFRAELDNAKRLGELHRQASETAKRRVQELEFSAEQVREDAADEISQLTAELDTERQERQAGERKIEEIELQLERLEASQSRAQINGSSPGSPRPGFNTLGGAGSPTISTPGRSRGGLNYTQMYAEYNSIKAELESEKRRNQKLNATIDDMIRNLETKEPEIQELQDDHTRLESEVAELSSLLELSGHERDAAKKEARKWQGQVKGLITEGGLLRQQLRDLNSQIKVLLVEVQIRDQGDQLSPIDRAALERLARNGDEEHALEGMSDTARFISQRLMTFRNVKELQEANERLLRLTRQLGEQMEGDEARAKQDQQTQDYAELETLRERVERYKDELQSITIQSQSFVRERDMFRRMLTHRGQLPPESEFESAFGQSLGSVVPSTPTANRQPSAPDQTPASKEREDYHKLLRDMQSHFDSYRQEAAIDHSTLRSQIDGLSKERGELQSQLARASSQLTLAHERLEMLQGNFNLLKNESGELQKRHQTLAENAARQDVRTQQVAEELIEAKGLAESLRNETSNLKAEKGLWKRIEQRLTEDNTSLVEERARLNKLLTDTQNLFNERDLSESETRRKLQIQVESQAAELQTLTRKLEEEVDDAKKASLRREYEQDQNRSRVDDLMKGLNNTKEELIAAKTTRDQLQARVEELKIELRGAEERSQALQILPSPQKIDESSGTTAEGGNREQELALEVADLRQSLDLAKGELENARGQVEQYKAISQSSEEELQSLNESQDLYRQEMDTVISEKDAKIKDLQQRVDDISSEMAVTNGELSEVRKTADHNTSRLEQQETLYKAEIARISDERDRYLETSKFHQEDLKAQAQIAQQAQQSYETELVKHAEATQILQKVRDQYNQLRSEVAGLRSHSEAARMTLMQNEESWTATREQYEREMLELRNRRDDINAQNKLLHQQLENVSAQIAGLQQNRSAASKEQETQQLGQSGLQNLQEVINYLRREKEIVDVQYELSVQEAKRLRQQLDYAQSQLDDARLRLDQERQRHSDSERSSMSHTKLMDTINELNVFRESSVTLRNEARQSQAQLSQKSKEAEELLAKVQPLETKVRELEERLETASGNEKLLEEDRDRWQQRMQNIMQKYDRVDPAELEALKGQIASLQKERDDSFTEKQNLQQQVDAIPNDISKAQDEVKKQAQESRERLVEQFKARSRDLSGKINEKAQENRSLLEEKEALQNEVESLKTELASVRAANEEALARVSQNGDKTQQESAVMQDTGDEGQIIEGQIEEERAAGMDTVNELGTRLTEAENNAREQSSTASQLQQELKISQTAVGRLENRVTELQEQLDAGNHQQKEMDSGLESDQGLESKELIDKLRQKVAEAKGEVEALKANATGSIASAPPSDGNTGPAAEHVQKQVETIRGELETAHATRMQQLEEQFKMRVDNMRKQLSTKLHEGKTAARQEQEAAVQTLQKSQAEAIAHLKTVHQQEINSLQKTAESLQEQVKNAAAGESQSAKSLEPTNAPAATENSFNEDSTVKVKAETSIINTEWSDAQVKDLVNNNQVVKAIVMRNIRIKVQQETEALKARMAEEQETVLAEKLDEARQKADKAREQAVVMEGKRWSVKISMADGKARTAVAKIEVFEKAAKDTPQRPVAEVWAIAKDVRPPPANQSQPQSQPGAAGKTALPSQQVQPSMQKPANQPNGNISTATAPSLAPPATPASPSQPPSTPTQTEAQQPKAPTTDSVPSQTSAQPARPNGTAGPKSSQNNAPAAGTGPAALRGIIGQGSAIPRGGGIPRAGGVARGGGRGGSTDAAAAQQPSQRGSALPRGGGHAHGQRGGRGGAMNAGATQFVPGNKRPREDSSDGGGTAGKRARGGQAGGAE